MDSGRGQLHHFTAHKRRAGSSFTTASKPTKKPAIISNRSNNEQTAKEKKTDDDKPKEANVNKTTHVEIKTENGNKLIEANRGHYGNLAYRSYLAKDYKRTIEYAEKQIAEGTKKFESLILKANALKKTGLFDLAIRDCLACLNIVRTSPAPYILAIQCFVANKDINAAYELVCVAIQSATQSHHLYKKLVSFKAELQLQRTKKPDISQSETISQNWVKILPLELMMCIFKGLTLFDILIMSQACKTWRYTLVRIPELWSNIAFDFNRFRSKSTKESNKKQYAELILQTFLSRSHTRLQSISLSHSPKLDWKWFSIIQRTSRPLLKQLHLKNTSVSAPFLKPALGAFGSQLTHLTLASCKLSEDSVALVLVSCPYLVSLDISGKGVPSRELFFNARGDLRKAYTSLHWLNLEETELGENFVENLGKVFPNLTGINLNRVGTFKVPLISNLCISLPKLIDISLQKMSYIFPYRVDLMSHFQLLGDTYSTLVCLNLSHNHFVNDQAILCLSASVASLKSLDISYTSVGEIGLGVFKFSPLGSLSLASCSQINDAAIASLGDWPCVAINNTLSILDLSGLKLEQATVALVISTFGGFIRELNLSSSSVNLFGLQSWLLNPPGFLEIFRMSNCPMVSTDFVSKLRKAISHAQIIHSVPS